MAKELLPEGIQEGGVAVCIGCGTVHDGATEYIANLIEQRELLERELRGKRSQIKRLKADQDTKLRASIHFPPAARVLERWRDLCMPSAKEILSADRLAPTIARLAGGFHEDQLVRACEGYALKPYVVNGVRSHEGPKDSWQADAELIFRTPRHVERGLAIADEADRLRGAIATPSAGNGNGNGHTDHEDLSDIGNAALRMARFGFYVFPVEERGKKPVTPNGLLDAKRDPATIIATWSRHPKLNVAVRTGAESGIVVLDVDGEIGHESLRLLERENEELPTTASVKTPRGGTHFYFAHPGRSIPNSASLLGNGIDIRGDGGYVLAPPSVGPNGHSYEPDEQSAPAPMPKWLIALIGERQAKVSTALANGDYERFLLEGAAQGNRNDQMTRIVGSLMNKHQPADVAFLAQGVNAQHMKPPMSPKEVEKVVLSVMRMRQRAAA